MYHKHLKYLLYEKLITVLTACPCVCGRKRGEAVRPILEAVHARASVHVCSERARVSISVCCLRRAVGDPQRTERENFDYILPLNIIETSM